MQETDTYEITYSDGRKETQQVARNGSCICAWFACIAILGQVLIWPTMLFNYYTNVKSFFETPINEKEYMFFNYKYEIAMGIILMIQLVI